MLENSKQANMSKITFADFDKLNLKSFAEDLFQIMEKGITSNVGASSVEGKGAYTISLNAEFGNGKTTFLKMFENFIKNEKQNYNVLSINAWESDFYKEPVIAILSELVNYLKENNKEDKRKKIIEGIGEIGNQLIKSKIGIDLKEVKTAMAKGEKILEDFNHRKEAIKETEKVLSEYTKDKRLLIIVDELDRTRSDYAVCFLEDMKHFFNIENVLFLVAVNKTQMEATVKCLYGQDLHFDGYYGKFFKQDVKLPYHYYKISDSYDETVAGKFISSLLRKTQQKQHEKQENKISIYISCKMFKLSLREIEQCIRIFEQIWDSEDSIIHNTYIRWYAFFICLFIKEKTVFYKILNNNFTIEDFVQFVKNNNYNFKWENEYTVARKYSINYSLGIVASSLFKEENSSEKDKMLMKQTFPVLMKYNTSEGSFYHDITRGACLDMRCIQPALEICRKINRCKSFSDKEKN